MEVMVLDNVILVLGIIIAVCVVAIGIYMFCKLEKEKQIEILKEWLLLAVVKAEKELGGGTGQLKLRFVYDLFLDKFKFLSYVITFQQFSLLVDAALITMKELVDSNKKVEEYIVK
jgi:hypothetical protein